MIPTSLLPRQLSVLVRAKFTPEREAIQAELRAALDQAGTDPLPGDKSIAFAERLEALAHSQVDEFLAMAEPYLNQIAGSRAGRRMMKRRNVVPRLRAEMLPKFLPGGLTAAQVRAKLELAKAKDQEIISFFMDALEE